MRLMVVVIVAIFTSAKPSCINTYTTLINRTISPIKISGNVLEIPIQYYNKCSLSAVTLNAFGNNVKLTSLEFVKHFQPSVIYLDASNNNITELPILTSTIHLTTVFLENNKIKDITYINKFRHLEVLHISYNKIVNLPEIKLPNLKMLNLRNNFIVSLNPWNLKASPKITLLELAENALTEVRMCQFKNEITINITKNPNFNYTNVICNRCVCFDDFGRHGCERLTDVCEEERYTLYVYIGIVVGIVVFIFPCLVGIIVWRRTINKRRSSPTSITDDEKVASKSLDNENIYDCVYDHLRQKSPK